MDWSSLTNLIVPTLIAVATYAWSRLRGEKTASITDTITGIGKQLVHAIVTGTITDANAAALTVKATTYLTDALAKLGIPVTGIVAAMVTAAAQQAIGDALSELRALDTTVADNLNALAAESKAASESFASADAAGRAAVAGMKDLIEVEPATMPAIPAAPLARKATT